MSKSEVGAGLGVAALLVVCCSGHLLLLALVGSGLAILTGQTVLIAAAVLVALVAVGAYAWRRRASQCATSTCAPGQARSAVRSLGQELDVTETPGTRELVSPGREANR